MAAITKKNFIKVTPKLELKITLFNAQRYNKKCGSLTWLDNVWDSVYTKIKHNIGETGDIIILGNYWGISLGVYYYYLFLDIGNCQMC